MTKESVLKSVARSMGASLKRSGHDVPHSTVLHALALALGGRDWNTLKASLTAESGPAQATREAKPRPRSGAEHLPGSEVPAVFVTDDQRVRVHFDARLYLAQASDKQLRSLLACGCGGDYPADEVAEFYVDKQLDEQLVAGFAYLEAAQRAMTDETIGFEVRLDETAVRAWLAQVRPELLQEYDAPTTRAELADSFNRGAQSLEQASESARIMAQSLQARQLLQRAPKR